MFTKKQFKFFAIIASCRSSLLYSMDDFVKFKINLTNKDCFLSQLQTLQSLQKKGSEELNSYKKTIDELEKKVLENQPKLQVQAKEKADGRLSNLFNWSDADREARDKRMEEFNDFMKKLFAIGLCLLTLQAWAMDNKADKKALEKGCQIILEACLKSCHTTYENRVEREKKGRYQTSYDEGIRKQDQNNCTYDCEKSYKDQVEYLYKKITINKEVRDEKNIYDFIVSCILRSAQLQGHV